MRASCRHENPQRKGSYLCRECVQEKARSRHRKKQNYDYWFQQQAGLCAFCGLPLEANSNKTHLDHDHDTGRERGLVHVQCNQMIGGIENAVRSIGWRRVLRYLLGFEV